MRWSQSLIPTLKETPSEAEIISHKLMIRAGLIRKLASGVYSYLPLGWRVLQKVEEIIRQEMNAKGSQEVLLPALQPKELWDKSGRYEAIKEIMVWFKDRHGRELILGPTHEEVITDLVANNVKSYRDLPLILYQIQTKFRDEPRPRFGVLRSCEFIMKDAYSFDKDWEGLEISYKKMYDAYCRIFERCGLKYIAVQADPGMMGGDVSHEFMVLAPNGEDIIALCKACRYAASLGKAEVKEVKSKVSGKAAALQEVDTPEVSTIEKVGQLLKVKPEQMVKTLIYEAEGKPVAVLIRGDHEANEAKLKRFLKVENLKLAEAKTIEEVTGAPVGFSGPVGLKNVKIIADFSIISMSNFVTGANKKDKHLINVNIKRDFNLAAQGDLRYITKEDSCPACGKGITIEPAIEVGHIFKLGTKYSKALGAVCLNELGKEEPVIMGCYGIGVNRIIASVIEQSNDQDGIIWPKSISPFQVLVMPLNVGHKQSIEAAEKLYEQLSNKGIEVLLDDRNERAGVKFKDADLIGIPVRVVIGEKKISQGKVELSERGKKEPRDIKVEEIEKEIKREL